MIEVINARIPSVSKLQLSIFLFVPTLTIAFTWVENTVGGFAFQKGPNFGHNADFLLTGGAIFVTFGF